MTPTRKPTSTMRIRLTDDRRERVRVAVRDHFADLDEDISDFRLEGLIDFFVRELGPPVYNQAIRDAHDFFERKLADLEGEFHEPDDHH